MHLCTAYEDKQNKFEMLTEDFISGLSQSVLIGWNKSLLTLAQLKRCGGISWDKERWFGGWHCKEAIRPKYADLFSFLGPRVLLFLLSLTYLSYSPPCLCRWIFLLTQEHACSWKKPAPSQFCGGHLNPHEKAAVSVSLGSSFWWL